MIVSVCADKGAPGVTTLATVLAMVWPTERVLLEADCSGGDLAFRLRHAESDGGRDRLLDPQPSVLALAADARGPLPTGGLLGYAQPSTLGLPVIPGALSPEAFSPMSRLWPQVAQATADWSGTAIADLGRLHPGDPALPVAKASVAVLLLTRPDLEGLYRLRDRVTELASTLGDPIRDRSPVAVVVRARPGKQAKAAMGQVRQLLEAAGSPIDVLGVLADDPEAIEELRAGVVSRRLLGSELVRSGQALVEAVLSCWPQLQAPPANPSVPPTSPVVVAPTASTATAAANGSGAVMS
jgi:hypothetical protein